MTRGAIRKTSRQEAVSRMLSLILAIPDPPDGAPPDAGKRPIAYRLEEYNGGKDPFAVHCADWSYGDRTPTSDCIGAVLWAAGIDRLQPTYNGSRGPWLNCGSLIDDADGARVYCEPAAYDGARAGDWLVTSTHIGMIVRPAIGGGETYDHVVVDCSPRHGRQTAINTGGPWSDACRVLRYRHFVDAI